MRNFVVAVAMLATLGVCSPAEAGVLDKAKSTASVVFHKAKHVVKKSLLLPVYLGAGVCTGAVVWLHFADVPLDDMSASGCDCGCD